jgi:peroxiredoxin
MIGAYGVMKATESRRAERCTFVVDQAGQIVLAYVKVKAKGHAARVLADIREARNDGRL